MIRRIARRLALAALLVPLVYLIACLFMLWYEPQLVYLPARPDEEWFDKPSAAIQDVTLHSPDGSLHGWYLPANKSDAVLLLCHGQAGNLSARGQGLPEYARLFNASMLIFDYPGYGISDGEPTEQGCYDAAESAYDWLRAKGFKPEQIIIYGESLGGGVAIELATRRAHSALLLVNTFANLPEVAQRVYPWAPVVPVMRNRFDSESRIAKCRSPIFLTHGTADRLIPFAHSLRLYEKITATKEFLTREGKNHTDPLGPDALEQMHAFLIRNGCLPKR
jgi:fermentation-respiration switch protein FrsA (DUF1100 family)